jgi:hypothetical protein
MEPDQNTAKWIIKAKTQPQSKNDASEQTYCQLHRSFQGGFIVKSRGIAINQDMQAAARREGFHSQPHQPRRTTTKAIYRVPAANFIGRP